MNDGLPASAPRILLAIETSCDETAIAVMDEKGHVPVHRIFSQIDQHRPFGGVVPEVASRCHVEALPPMLDEVIAAAGLDWSAIEGVAFTRGPGLATSLLTGMASARALAYRLQCPITGVNHLHGHAVSIRLTRNGGMKDIALPALILLVSGGHTMLLLEETPARYRLLGQTLDDAAGEALDKGAKLMGLGYPGGPEIEAHARTGDPAAFAFPRGLARNQEASHRYCFSFSGLKTSLMVLLKREPSLKESRLADLAASYQEAVVDALMLRVVDALDHLPIQTLACAGGVARNARLREKLSAAADHSGVALALTEPEFCADNAAMIAASARLLNTWADPVAADLDVLPGWGLGEDTGTPHH